MSFILGSSQNWRSAALREHTKILAMLDLSPRLGVAQVSEVRLRIEACRLFNLGIGLTDAQLIASIFLNPPTLLWTRDKALRRSPELLAFTLL
ncbi:MAG: hypothetical protein JO356_06320 [Acidobacteria bacterium]|nr:hypothetical protein [Acidobacteriota bacterium]